MVWQNLRRKISLSCLCRTNHPHFRKPTFRFFPIASGVRCGVPLRPVFTVRLHPHCQRTLFLVPIPRPCRTLCTLLLRHSFVRFSRFAHLRLHSLSAPPTTAPRCHCNALLPSFDPCVAADDKQKSAKPKGLHRSSSSIAPSKPNNNEILKQSRFACTIIETNRITVYDRSVWQKFTSCLVIVICYPFQGQALG